MSISVSRCKKHPTGFRLRRNDEGGCGNDGGGVCQIRLGAMDSRLRGNDVGGCGNDVDGGGGLASVSPVEQEDAVALDDEVDG